MFGYPSNPPLISRNSRRTSRRATLALAAGLLLAACGGDSAAKVGTNDSSQPTTPGARVVVVQATNFDFEPKIITASPGEVITLQLVSKGSKHDLAIDVGGQLARVVYAEDGETIEGGWQVPSEPGTYELFCSIVGHKSEGMVGQLVVA